MTAIGRKAAAVASHLTERIYAGEWPPGRAIPTHADLMDEYDVASNTLSASMRLLYEARLVEARGRSRHVAAELPDPPPENLLSPLRAETAAARADARAARADAASALTLARDLAARVATLEGAVARRRG